MWFGIIFTAITRGTDFYPISQTSTFCALWTTLRLLLILKVWFQDRRSKATPKPYVHYHVTWGVALFPPGASSSHMRIIKLAASSLRAFTQAIQK